MKNFAFLKTCVLLLAGAFLTQTAAAQVKQTRQLTAFQTIKASGATIIYLRQGPQTAVVVEAPEEAQPYIKTEVQGGTLRIYRESEGMSATVRSLFNNEKNGAKIYITCPQLSGLELSGATDVKGQTPFQANDFSIKASGASDVILQISAKSLTVSASGASDIKLSGQVERQQVHISGSSDYRASELLSKQATVEASGASDASVSAQSLSSNASGSSDIHNKK